jgi:DNA-binding response OmpR family regulator
MTSPRRLILVVEDDVEIGKLIARTLESYDFDVVHVTRGGSVMKTVKESRPVGCVVDLGLPDVDGLQLIRQLADTGVAILAVTGRGDVADRVVGLELGADDYLVKPFEPRELVARLNSVLRRMSRRAEAHAVATFAGWQFDVDALSLTAPSGERVALSRAEAQLLELFVRSPHRVLSREQLLDACGTAEDVFDRSIDVRISRLRQKVGDDPQTQRFIRTVYGAGYLFDSAVEWSKGG